MFPDDRTPKQKRRDNALGELSLYSASNEAVDMLMSLATAFKMGGMDSCSNDLVECAITLRKCAAVQFSILSDAIEDMKDGK